MPKKYRVEMTLVEEDDGTDTDLLTETISEYPTEQAARDGFDEKKNKAKGQGQGPG
jgi:hypothetical protein